MPYINVDEAYILDNTGLQVDNSVDYANANSNRNLLDNWYFGKPINQRGITSQDAGTSTSPYCIDRWRNARSVVTVNSGYITINSNSSGYGMVERVELYRMTAGEVYTLSVMMSNGTIYSGSFTYSTTASYIDIGSTSVRGYHQTDTSGEGNIAIWLIPSATGTNVNIKAVKLEKGSYSTLINDVPPDYGEELLKCMRYFYRLNMNSNRCYGVGFAESTTSVRMMIPLPVPMRTNPNQSSTPTSGTIRLKGNGSLLTPSAFSTQADAYSGSASLAITVSGATQYAIYALSANDAAYIDFSADL